MESFEQFENTENLDRRFELDNSQQQLVDLELNYVGGEDLLLNGNIDTNRDLVIEVYDKTIRQIKPSFKSAVNLSPMKSYNTFWSAFIDSYLESPYLEALSDKQQIEMISDYMTSIEDIKFENWKDLTIKQKMSILNEMEQCIARIEHRPSVPIYAEMMDNRTYGYNHYEPGSPEHNKIAINIDVIEQSSLKPENLDELLDTLIHEGRHSYQHYNVDGRLVHESQAAVETWRENFEQLGYKDGSPVHIIEIGPLRLFTNKRLSELGHRLYYYQPVEVDARVFAKDVMIQYRKKMEV